MTRIALLRHGHTSWNRAGRIQGRTDIPLDDAARQDLSQLALPSAWRDATVIASPLERARETAWLISGTRPKVEDDLIEMNWGAWEGQQGADLKADPSSGYTDIESWGWGFCPPDGEALDSVRTRVRNWAEACTQDSVVVTHIGVMRVMLAIAMSWGFDRPAPFKIKRNRLYVVNIQNGVWSASADAVALDRKEKCAS